VGTDEARRVGLRREMFAEWINEAEGQAFAAQGGRGFVGALGRKSAEQA